MRGILLLFLIVLSATFVYSSMLSSDSVYSASGIIVKRLWDKAFYGVPQTHILVINSGSEKFFVVGTSLGLLAFNKSDALWFIHAGSVHFDPICVGEYIYFVSGDRLFKVGSSGDLVGTLDGIGGIFDLLFLWDNIVVLSTTGYSTYVLVFDLSLNEVNSTVLDVVYDYGLFGDIDGDGLDDLILVSKLGVVSVFDRGFSLVLNVSLNVSALEIVGFNPVIGDFDGDLKDEVAVGVSAIRSYASRIDLVGDDGVRHYYVDRQVTIASGSDLNDDGYVDLLVGVNEGICGLDIRNNVTIFEFNVSDPLEPRDQLYYVDSLSRIIYASKNGSLVLFEDDALGGVFGFDGDYIVSYVLGENLVAVSIYGRVAVLSQSLVVESVFVFPTELSSNISPMVFGDGSVFVPLISNLSLIGDEKSYFLADYGIKFILSDYGDVDGDGYLEGILVSENGGIYCLDDEGVNKLFDFNGSISGLSAGDLERDGRDEIILNSGSAVWVFGSINWTINISDLALVSLPIFDFDSDLNLEILAPTNDGTTYIIASNGTVEAKINVFPPITKEPPVGDVNMDRSVEAIVWDDRSISCVDLTGGTIYHLSKGIHVDSIPILTDVDADGFLETIFVDGRNLLVYDNAGNLKRNVSFTESIVGFSVLDLESDYIQDALIVSGRYLYIKNLVTGEDDTNPIALDFIGGKAFVFAGDFDGDGSTEIVVVSDGVAYFEVNADSLGEWRTNSVYSSRTYNTLNYDRDSDGLTDWEEIYIFGTNPYDRDTDKDGYSDYQEIENNWDPLDPSSPPRIPLFWISLLLSLVILVIIVFMFWRKFRQIQHRK